MLSEPLSEPSVEDWVEEGKGKISFGVTQSECPVIAVDQIVVKGGGRPIYGWVAVDAYTR